MGQFSYSALCVLRQLGAINSKSFRGEEYTFRAVGARAVEKWVWLHFGGKDWMNPLIEKPG